MLITKIEAREACDWLRAAGFPQYVQLFKDCRFPVDVAWARRDHRFLDDDALDSLCRRLSTLNKCAEMKLEPRRSKRQGDDCDEEDFCAISPSWTYDRRARRWRRLDSSSVEGLGLTDSPTRPRDPTPSDVSDRHDACSILSSSSADSDGHDKSRGGRVTMTTSSAATDDQETSGSSSPCSSRNKTPSLDTSFSGPPSPVESPDKPQRKTSTSLLRKMEKLRPRATALLPSAGRLVISRSVLIPDQGRGEGLRCSSRPDSRASSSPPHTSSSSQSESSSTVSTPSPVTRVRSNCKRSDSGAGTARNSQNATGAESARKPLNNHGGLVFHIPDGHKPGTFPTSLAHNHAPSRPAIDSTAVNWRTGSFHGYRSRNASPAAATRGPSSAFGAPSPLASSDHRLSVYDNVPGDQRLSAEPEVSPLLDGEDVFSALDRVLERINDLQQLVSSWSEDLSEDDFQRGSSSSSSSSCHTHDSPVHSSSATSPCPSSPSHIHLEVKHPEEEEEEEEEEDEQRREKLLLNGGEPPTGSSPPRSRVSQRLHWSSEQSLLPPLTSRPAVENQSVSQFLQLQKHSLLKLTALMDKHSPSSKQGWSWTVPKPQRKTKVVEVKGQRVFGAPLLVSARRSGAPLPPSILRALVHLRSRCLDQVGLFRKSGVKSRIQFLRQQVESDPDGVSYDGQSAFDVADLVKQYFRDLPEPVFPGGLGESFLHIYQYFPKDQQLVAAQAAMLLLPDENREALMTLLFFLRDVVASVDENQMTPTNLAVCLAPSLFHLNTVKRDARSSPRKFSLGRPDQRDLSENLAATQALADMITQAPRLFQFPEFWPGRCPSAAPEDVPPEDRRDQLLQLTQHLLKEARGRSPGWESHASPEQVELSFKKVDDGCPLWLWRGSVDVDAPQTELLRRLLREQELWEGNLRRSAVVHSSSKDTEIYHYLLRGQGPVPRPPQDHLLLRTWQADPSSGPLYVSSVSTEHPEVQLEGVRAHVHSCLYLLESTGDRKTRLTHLCRTDTRGRSYEWHSRVSGHLLAAGLLSIRDSFRGHFRETKI